MGESSGRAGSNGSDSSAEVGGHDGLLVTTRVDRRNVVVMVPDEAGKSCLTNVDPIGRGVLSLIQSAPMRQ